MAEFKNVFIKSKMNKDLDDRLLPQGEYRNAVNIQVSKSESEDVGALENVLGNEQIINFENVTGSDSVICIGYLVSEVNSCVFFFLTDNTIASNASGVYAPGAENYIIRSVISSGVAISNTILVEGAFLNFWEGSPIYGVNLLENLLFWTDNRNQPRKINVDSAVDDSTYYQIEDTISVAKYMPYTAPLLWQEVTQKVIDNSGTPTDLQPALGQYQTTMQDVVSEFLPDGTTVNPYEEPVYQGDPDYLEDKFVRFGYRFKFDDGEYSVFSPFTQECFIPKQDGFFLFNPSGADNDDNDQSASFRSTVVNFMENKVNQITLLIQMPENGDPAFATTTLNNTTDYFKITEVEILYKESNGAAVLVLDRVSADDIKAQYDAADPSNTYLYKYSGTKPFKTLPEAQLVRVYDKVPVKALGQEVISNRIVYSNFQTRHTPPTGIDYNVGAGTKLAFDVSTPATPVSWNTSIVEYPNNTLKQNRNYQAGFVLSDRFSRTTSTILSNAATTTGATAGQLSTVYSPYNPSQADGGPDMGLWPGDALFVQVNDPISETPLPNSLYPGTYKGDPSQADYNPLGFYSWKVVVKQQEQDYYNVYLPGIMAAYPDDPTKELGLTSHTVLINDNINKVPRDLSEVGPDQKQFRSSVQLFGRVQNTATAPTGAPATDFGVTNEQYYPGLSSDTVSTISTMVDMFGEPLGTTLPVEFEQFYEYNSNPLIARISTENQIGQISTTNPNTGIQYLAVYETEPVESRLDIYWETSTSGRIDQLNEQVEATGGQTIFSTQNFNFEFNEYWGIYDPATPWDPTVQGSPEPGPSPAATPPDPTNGELGRYRSVVCGPFWFEDNVFQEIQDITVVSFTVTDAAGANVTADFDLLQIKGTGSSPTGPGNYIDYAGNTTTTFAWDTFLIVNKSYRLWQTTTPNIQEFDFEIQVTDDSFPGPSPAPIKTFTYTPLANGTILTDLPTINVGGRSFGSLPAEWGQNPSATPTASPPILDYDKVCPPSEVIVDYGILGTIVEFYGMNGANYGNPASVPASNNQVGLQWTIDSISQAGVAAPGIFNLDSVTGVLTEVSPGTASGRYDIRIKVTGPDGTFDICLFALIIGVPQADGSFSNGNGSANTVMLFYDEAYALSLHNNQPDAFAQMSSSSGSFQYIWPNVSSMLGASLTGFTSAACNNYTAGSGFVNTLQRYQVPFGGGGAVVGALTQGTGYIWLDCEIPGFYGSLGQYNSCDLSMAIEFRPTPTSNWEAAYDIEGQYLSFNSLVANSVTNPWPSDTTIVGQSANNTSSNDYDQIGGCVTPFIGGVGSPSNNYNRVVSQNKTSSSGPSGFARISKLIAVGNSPTYGIPGAFGEYRVIIQSIGGNCFSCQGCGSSGPQSVKAGNNFIGEIGFGDFFYSLGPQRAFAYRLNPTLTVGPTGALNTSSHTQQVYAREPVHRYVSTFYSDVNLTVPFTSYITSTGATYVSYIAAASAGAGYTTPLNAGSSTASNVTFAKAAEGAATNNANNGTTQNLRVWAKNVNPATGTFVAGTAVPNSN